MIRRILILAIVLLAAFPGNVAADRDPLAPVLDMPEPPVASVPGDLFQPDQVEDMTRTIKEARQFGVPLAVRVISMPVSPETLRHTLPFKDAMPSSQEIVQGMADYWLSQEPLETSSGAADGILLFVVVPENDHTKSMAAFATGKNTLPLNGLTHQSLEDVLNQVIRPYFSNGTIANGIDTGVAMLSYDNLFARPARLERTEQQETLFTITNTVLLGVTLAASFALIWFAWWIGRRHRSNTPDPHGVASPFEAASLLRGRVDRAVIAGALLHLVRIGAIVPHGEKLRVVRDVPSHDPLDQDILELLVRESTADGILSTGALRHVQDALDPARTSLEDRLARRGLFNPVARVESVWLVLASALVATIALLILVPSIVSMSRVGLAGILIAALSITGVLIWAAKRSWATPAGQAAVREWLNQPHTDEDLRIVDTIVNQDALLDSPGGPDVTPTTRLIREFRALGAG